ncbi:hypothetical protein E2C01_096655 [Portunus trituberculatus]|uniref:Uncharacterized protein n=1 Tax=Portunus trituberculatus TaxID=210409 RepID=A0A5B7K7T3_PORTR|nr:hypothetical protein [Portunus trituberculatus]
MHVISYSFRNSRGGGGWFEIVKTLAIDLLTSIDSSQWLRLPHQPSHAPAAALDTSCFHLSRRELARWECSRVSFLGTVRAAAGIKERDGSVGVLESISAWDTLT